MPSVTIVDMSDVPEALESKWVVFRESDHIALGNGDSPREALADAGVTAEDPNILLARIPSRTPTLA